MPEPILVAIAAAIAGKGASSLYDAIKTKFGRSKESTTVLGAADGADPDSTEVLTLAEELSVFEHDDPEFACQLRELWRTFAMEHPAEKASVTNQIAGRIEGKVVQASVACLRSVYG
jgi:hypothetical protein